MIRLSLLAALSGCAVACHAPAALACRCVPPALAAAYEQADAVAEVRIVAVSSPSADGSISAEGEVVAAWKTRLPNPIRIVTGEDCAYPMKANTIYLLYLSKGRDVWGTYECRGNRVLGKAHAALHWLGRHGVSGG
jgi:hypothetical protein